VGFTPGPSRLLPPSKIDRQFFTVKGMKTLDTKRTASRIALRPILVGLTAGGLLASLSVVGSAQTVPADDPKSKVVVAAFSDVGGRNQPGCVVALRQGSNTRVVLAQGSANISDGIALTKDTVFDIASMSKQFTAASVQMLVADGRVKLSDDIRTYFPELPKYAHVVTIEHLMHHTSGLPDYTRALYAAGNDAADVVTTEQAIGLLASEPKLAFVPGSRFTYNNSGYFLMAQLVERVAKMSINEFATKRIFAPLGMKHTKYQMRHDELIVNKASGYKVGVDGSLSTANSNWEPAGDGSVQSTAGDMLIWADELMTGKRFGAAFRQSMLTPGKTATDQTGQTYASGVYLTQVNGQQVIRHAGNWYGFTSDIEIVPSKKLAVVALCNIDTISAQLAPKAFVYPGRDPQTRLVEVVKTLTR
jgi:CubicO group peptidase (beta-lactamase class C family)